MSDNLKNVKICFCFVLLYIIKYIGEVKMTRTKRWLIIKKNVKILSGIH